MPPITSLPINDIARTEVKRDRYGRYIIPNAKGDPTSFTRATTIAGMISDRHGLEQWQLRMLAYGLGQRPDLIALAQSHKPQEDKRTYRQITDDALTTAKSGAAASIGTALHRFTEDVDLGTRTIDDIPKEHQTHMQRYRDKMDAAGLDILSVEQILLNDDYIIAGTCDRVVALADGRHLIADLKTGAELSHSALQIAIQLAIYANHTATFDPIKNKRGKRIEVDREEAIVIHLPVTGDKCKLYTVDISAGWDACLTAIEVREWRTRNGLFEEYLPFAVGTGGDTALADWITGRFKELANHKGALADLKRRWPPSVPQPWPDTPTVGHIDAIADVLSYVESLHEVPFGPARPGQTTRPPT